MNNRELSKKSTRNLHVKMKEEVASGFNCNLMCVKNKMTCAVWSGPMLEHYYDAITCNGIFLLPGHCDARMRSRHVDVKMDNQLCRFGAKKDPYIYV